MKVLLRHFALGALPLVGGVGAGLGFAALQRSCVALVGVVLAAKCHARQLEYQTRFELLGAAVGVVVAAGLGAWLERRRVRAARVLRDAKVERVPEAL